MMNLYWKLLIITTIMWGAFYLNATNIGSYDTPSRESFVELVDPSNSLFGFAVFYQGFALNSYTVTVTWDCYFPVGDTVTLNGGTLYMTEDFKLASNASFENGGLIECNGHIISLPNSVDQFDLTGSFTVVEGTIILNSAVALDGELRIQGNCTIDGCTNVLTLTSGTIVIDAGAHLTIKNTTFKGIQAGTIYCEDDTGSVELENVMWIQDGDYSFDAGVMTIRCNTTITGGHIFAYQSTQQSTILANSTLFFDSSMTFSYDTNANDRLSMVDETSLLHLYETTLYSSTSTGLRLTKGTVVVEGECPVISEATSKSEGIWLGDGSNKVSLNILPESNLNDISGWLVYENVQ